MGDMQEHKYKKQRAWKKGAMPHKETKAIEDTMSIIKANFDAKAGVFKSEWAVLDEKEKAETAKALALAGQKYKPFPRDIDNDWTGHKYAVYWKTYGQGPALAQKQQE